jgi:hypothetical protein
MLPWRSKPTILVKGSTRASVNAHHRSFCREFCAAIDSRVEPEPDEESIVIAFATCLGANAFPTGRSLK